MRDGTQTDIPIDLAECLALARRWAEAYGFELRGLPSLKMVEAVGPEPGFPIFDAAGDFLGVYREFVHDAIETTKAGNAEGLKVQIDLREAERAAG